MIHSIDEQGNLTWHCPHTPEEADAPCGTQNTAHISHEAIQWHGHPDMKPEHHTVSLPPCSGCGAQTFLKVHFTERELKAPNMWQEWNSTMEAGLMGAKNMIAHPEEYEPEEVTEPQLTALASQIAEMEVVKAAGGYHLPSHAIAQRHIQLREHLLAVGKTPQTT